MKRYKLKRFTFKTVQMIWKHFLPPANIVCEGYIFTGICDSVNGGCAWLLRGGMHGCSRGHAWLLGGHAWLLWGGHAWFSLGGMCGFFLAGVHGFLLGGMYGCSWGACVVFAGGHVWFLPGGHVWFLPGGMHGFSLGGMHRIRQDTVNEWVVRILLECILVGLMKSHLNL